MTGMLAHALSYAAGAWPVIPLHTPVGGRCDCLRACDSPGKHPRTAHGLTDASTDPDQIRKWWDMWPDANVGLVIPDGYVVVDVDVAEASSVANGHELPTTASAKTGRGWHFLYRTPTSVRPAVGVLEHVDLRGPGSYIVAPPSVHVSGARYVWVSTPGEGIAEAPAWILEAGARTRELTPDAVGAPIVEGARNATLTRIAGAMRRHGTTADELYAALSSVNAARVVPPLPDDELRAIAHSVARYQPAESAGALVAEERPQARPASSVDPAIALFDRWHVEGVLRPGRLMVLASQEGVGKSHARAELAIRKATGRGALFGHYPLAGHCRVLLVDVENGEDEETRREEEILERLDLDHSELDDYWRVSLEGLLLTDPADQAYIRAEVERFNPGIVIFDTGSSMVGEEWGKELKLAVRFLRALAREYGCAVIVVVHLVKPSRQAKHKDAPEHGTELSDVMGQWTRQADSVALMARTKDDLVVWTMRKRVPRSTLILAPDGGTFHVITAVVGGELGADTRAKVQAYLAKGVTDTAAIAQLTGVTRRTVQRHVAKLVEAGDTVSSDVAARVAGDPEREATPRETDVADSVADQAGDTATLSPPPIGGDVATCRPRQQVATFRASGNGSRHNRLRLGRRSTRTAQRECPGSPVDDPAQRARVAGRGHPACRAVRLGVGSLAGGPDTERLAYPGVRPAGRRLPRPDPRP
jgi:hypothetical protein